MSPRSSLQTGIPLLHGKRILLGVTGSIAAYKAVTLASLLTQAEAEVDVIMSEAATHFIAPLTFQAVTGRPVYRDEDLWGAHAHILHVELARAADLFIVAPATANTLADLANGAADSLVTLAALAVDCPLVLAPAMDAGMYGHPAVQENVTRLRERGAIMAGPAEGRMASGLQGLGRLLEPEELLGHIRLALAAEGPLKGDHFLVTAGGTQEPLDPVRSLANRSSGKQGFALAQAALDRGARVTLIAGPTTLPTPIGADRIDVRTTEEMRAAVLDALEQADGLLMAAAVSDFRPVEQREGKIKKEAGPPPVELEPTPDILAEVGRLRLESGRPAALVGFAAESEALEENARKKLQAKGLDLIVANDVTASDSGFGVDTNRVTILDSDGGVQALPVMSKTEVAERVFERVEDILANYRLSS
jgi:phosphopantothenoylcysteine decarboxylase/phosphopantothenate--cysteine ligase